MDELQRIFDGFNQVNQINSNESPVDTVTAMTVLPVGVVTAVNEASKGENISILNTYLEVLSNKLKGITTDNDNIKLAIISSNNYAVVHQPLINVNTTTQIPIIGALGKKRCIAQGIELALSMLLTEVRDSKKETQNKVKRPWLIIVTDGCPTDSWEDTANKLKELSTEKKIIPIVINYGIENDQLEHFSIIPPFQIQPSQLPEMVSWVCKSLSLILEADEGTVRLKPPELNN